MRIPVGTWGILVLTALAAALRLAGVWDASLSHDELITLERLRFHSFTDLIQQGVLVDTHPAGVHVFLWLWTHLVGWSDFWIRWPFVLMGIACVPLAYVAVQQWSNSTTALLAAAFMAVAQFPVYYSGLARPYIPGLFWMLLAIPPFVALVFKGSTLKRNAAWLALAWAGLAYTQHLAMVHAAVMAVAGWLWVPRTGKKAYLLACAGALLLYVPHVSITWHQFQRGGVGGAEGWLAAPTWEWPNHYLAYLTHFIPGAMALLLLRLAFQKPWSNPLWLKAGLLALLPMGIALAYSMWVNPLLQYSGLLYGLPFWLILLLYRSPNTIHRKGMWEPALMALILVVTLVRDRQHFHWIKELGYRTFAAELKNHPQRRGLHRDAYRCVAHYLPSGNWVSGMPNDAVSQDSLRRWLLVNPVAELQVGNVQPQHLAVIREFYPAETVLHQGFTSENRLFTTSGQPWPRTVFHAAGKVAFAGSDVFQAVKRMPFDSLVAHPWDRIGIAAKGMASGVVAYLVIKNGEEALVWKHVPIQNNAIFNYNVSDLLTDLKEQPHENTVVEVGLLNESGNPVVIDSLYAWIEEGNRWQYTLIAPIPQPYAR